MRNPRTGEFEVRSVADVRRIKICVVCKAIGKLHDGMVRVTGKRNARGALRDAAYAHTPCFLLEMRKPWRARLAIFICYPREFSSDTAALFSLPDDELEHVQPLMDLTTAQAKRFIAECVARKVSP